MELINLNSMIRSVKQGCLTTNEEIREKIDQAKKHIDETELIMIKALEIRRDCKHEFAKPTFTVQRRVIGFATVYSRKCSLCGYEEISTNEKPAWAENATERYFNNTF